MEIILFGLLAVMLVFMFVNTRKRQKQMKAEQEEKAAKSVPGARVLLQGGLYGTIVEYDAVDLDKPARIEIAPGVVIDVHSQAILRIVEPTDAVAGTTAADATLADDADATVTAEAGAAAPVIEDEARPADAAPSRPETPEETRARLERDGDI
ncbi:MULTISPECIES: preprotein translocase subunit YajC [Microbacterium]|uniref:preprotein translocase subunit YajC n=1 Tax=Microbacterium TaxID=33882 RepID=UPI00217E869A|nr:MULTISPECIES: preprotein translocase subunit YajC [Microbacterium]UWF76521.1 preprotein translocase subunit YajC [Microbacterium neungamense]WCM54673.1 preprotein translocase subunit YajC [Microbacterium sp. EF45047]